MKIQHFERNQLVKIQNQAPAEMEEDATPKSVIYLVFFINIYFFIIFFAFYLLPFALYFIPLPFTLPFRL